MANYQLQAGNVNQGHLNAINELIRLNDGTQVDRVAFMASRAINGCPYNQAPTQAQVGVWANTRGLRMVFNAGDNNWEGHVISGIYRIDFQGYTADRNYANWQIQFGHGQHQGGTAAHVLISLRHTFSLGDFIEALRRSARTGNTCRLEP